MYFIAAASPTCLKVVKLTGGARRHRFSLQLQRGLHQEDGPLPQQEDLIGEPQEAEGPERSPEKLHRRPQEEGERRPGSGDCGVFSHSDSAPFLHPCRNRQPPPPPLHPQATRRFPPSKQSPASVLTCRDTRSRRRRCHRGPRVSTAWFLGTPVSGTSRTSISSSPPCQVGLILV